MAIAAHWKTPASNSMEHTTFHPVLRLCTPPAIITIDETMAQSSMTMSNDMRKLTVRHMLQKYSSFMQSVCSGKGVHLPVMVEQRLCRPMEYSRLSFCEEC